MNPITTLSHLTSGLAETLKKCWYTPSFEPKALKAGFKNWRDVAKTSIYLITVIPMIALPYFALKVTAKLALSTINLLIRVTALGLGGPVHLAVAICKPSIEFIIKTLKNNYQDTLQAITHPKEILRNAWQKIWTVPNHSFPKSIAIPYAAGRALAFFATTILRAIGFVLISIPAAIAIGSAKVVKTIGSGLKTAANTVIAAVKKVLRRPAIVQNPSPAAVAVPVVAQTAAHQAANQPPSPKGSRRFAAEQSAVHMGWDLTKNKMDYLLAVEKIIIKLEKTKLKGDAASINVSKSKSKKCFLEDQLSENFGIVLDDKSNSWKFNANKIQSHKSATLNVKELNKKYPGFNQSFFKKTSETQKVVQEALIYVQETPAPAA